MISIVVTMGFINQDNIEIPELGDEFDHFDGIWEADAPFELVIIDRAWPTRWSRMARIFNENAKLERIQRTNHNFSIKYIPCKPSVFVDIGYRAVNAMRNTGAIVSSGDIIVFVDDFFVLTPESIEQIWEAYEKDGSLLCPVHRKEVGPPEDFEGDQEFSGHNPGIYMCTREQFIKLGGFNEHFDGGYGESDTEWQERLDRLLDTTEEYKLRTRRHGLIWRKTHHTNGMFPQKLQYPWPDQFPEIDLESDPNNLRCNRAYYRLVVKPRIESGDLQTFRPLEKSDIEALKEGRCVDNCGLCGRADREHQVLTYWTMPADHRVVEQMYKFQENPDKDVSFFDPWENIRT